MARIIFAARIQLLGYDVDHHFIRRIENGERFITDIEILLFCDVFDITPNELFAKM